MLRVHELAAVVAMCTLATAGTLHARSRALQEDPLQCLPPATPDDMALQPSADALCGDGSTTQAQDSRRQHTAKPGAAGGAPVCTSAFSLPGKGTCRSVRQ